MTVSPTTLAVPAGPEGTGSAPDAELLDDLPLTWGDPIMAPVVEAVARVAATRAPVTIVGEIGCGKTAVARAIHTAGANASGPLILFDCRQPESRQSDGELSRFLRPCSISS